MAYTNYRTDLVTALEVNVSSGSEYGDVRVAAADQETAPWPDGLPGASAGQVRANHPG